MKIVTGGKTEDLHREINEILGISARIITDEKGLIGDHEYKKQAHKLLAKSIINPIIKQKNGKRD